MLRDGYNHSGITKPDTRPDYTVKEVDEYIDELQRTRGDGYGPGIDSGSKFERRISPDESELRWSAIDLAVGCSACASTCIFGGPEKASFLARLKCSTEHDAGGSFFGKDPANNPD